MAFDALTDSKGDPHLLAERPVLRVLLVIVRVPVDNNVVLFVSATLTLLLAILLVALRSRLFPNYSVLTVGGRAPNGLLLLRSVLFRKFKVVTLLCIVENLVTRDSVQQVADKLTSALRIRTPTDS